MTDNVHQLPSPQPGRAPFASRSGLRPASTEQAIGLLTGCLALVRPVGMSSDEAEDWLAVASGAVAELPFDLLRDGCETAKRTCTHHGQIISTIHKAVEDRLAQRRRLANSEYIPPARQLTQAPKPKVPFTQADVDCLPPMMVRIGLHCGALIENADGTVSPAPDAA